MSLFEEIKQGLEEAIEYNKGKLKARTTTRFVLPLETFTAKEIKDIRTNAGMTQSLFAQSIGVSKKTVEAWESGRNHPDGAACRLLALLRETPEFMQQVGIVG